MTPEQKARKKIDSMLGKAGWIVQNMDELSPVAGLGVAVREYPTDDGPADYLLFVDGSPTGVLEAKPEGTVLSQVEDQTARYASAKLKWRTASAPLRFLYESSGSETWFTDTDDPAPRAREVFSFHRPETLRLWLKDKGTLRGRLKSFPSLDSDGLRQCQYDAIGRLEDSFAHNRPRALVHMATGAGKTFTAITSVYRLLKFGGAKRILFLVDTRNLGEQAEQEFTSFTPQDDTRKFKELYNVQRLQSSVIDSGSQVCISTIQRMYSILQGEELDESAEDTSMNESQLSGKAREVSYNPKVPIETFDFIVIDECHRSIYNLWKQVLDYFDAFLIGLTATPDNRTYGFFNKNVVSEYKYEQSVADGVNVPYDVFIIETAITKEGARIPAGEYVDKRKRDTRKRTWEQLDDEVSYVGKELDRSVVNPDQIRTVIRSFREKLFTEIFPGRREVPKTLIFAKTDSHAEDIIRIVREEFEESNKFCKKITYNNKEENPQQVLQQFRTAPQLRIAVTVDMVATGTDVRPLECLIFMRDVRSRSYFEQMKGRGTRTATKDEMLKVTPDATENKSHFVIVDAVGVCASDKTDSRPLERKRGVSMRDLMLSVVMGSRDEDTLTSLANRLTRLEKQIDKKERTKMTELAGGKSINQVVTDLLEVWDPDRIESIRKEIRTELPDLSPEQQAQTFQDRHEALQKEATAVFQIPAYRDYVENVRRGHDQIIDTVNIDTLTHIGWQTDSAEKAGTVVTEFRDWLESHKDEITALQIFYGQPYRRRELTYAMIRELCDRLKADKPLLAPMSVWKSYEQLEKVNGSRPKNELIVLVSLLHRVLEIDPALTAYDITVNRNFQEWVFGKQRGTLKFTEEQMDFLRMMKEHIAASVHLDRDDLENTPFVEKGGLMKVWKLFGQDMDNIIDELNEALAA